MINPETYGPDQTLTGASTSGKNDLFYDIKHRIHERIVEEINLAVLDEMDPEEVKPEVSRIVERFLEEEKVLLNVGERKALVEEILDELMGLGPLEPLLRDDTISDILCNTYKDVYIERRGILEKADCRFADNAHLLNIIDRIISRVGRRVDESSPMVDARLPDGSRVNAIIPPAAIDGPLLSIRRFGAKPLQMEDLINFKTITPEIAEFMADCVQAKLNIMISGGTGSGKTTLLNVFSSFIPGNERIVTIEDSAELQLQQQHVVRLEVRPPSIEGTGEITQRDLVRNSLRMRPDRIIIGEVRGPESFDMLQAMNTGHEGSLTTIHANSARDSLTRLESMILQTGINLPEQAMRFMMSSALDLIVQVERLVDGSRKIVSISEVVGMEGYVITLQDIFVFEKRGIDKKGGVIGRFKATGIRPHCVDRLELAGIRIPDNLFSPEKIYE
ncbi:MAG: CpaF family protein [Desulfurivibrionaceae bacterium]|nr:CpaF family protein [Desulfurivibrionaceae bacterium]